MPDAGDGKELMSAAELKPLLMQSKRKPVSCVIGMTKDKQGVLLLDKKVKPRKLLAEAKTQARSAGLELDLVSLRFGRASVDAADSGTVQFVVNKDAPGALRPKLVEKLRPAGIRKCEIGVDAALESESEDDEPGAAPDSGDGTGRPGAGAEPGAGAAASTGPAGGAAGTAGTPPESQGAAAGPQDTDGDTHAPGSPALGAAPDGVPRDGDGAAGPRPDRGNGRAASDKAAVTRRLSGLVSRMAEALPGRPPGAQAMRAAADEGQQAVHAGDVAGASKAADTLEQLLGGTAGKGGAADGGSPDAASAGSDGNPAEPQARPVRDGSTSGTGPAAPAAPGDGTGAAGPAGPAGARQPTTPSPVFEKGRKAWAATCAKVEKDVQAVVAKAAAHYGQDSPQAKTIRDGLEPIIHRFDDRLTAKLADLSNGADGTAQGRAVAEVQAIIQDYVRFVDTDPMVALLEKNPMHPVKLRAVLDTALAALTKQPFMGLHTDGNVGMVLT